MKIIVLLVAVLLPSVLYADFEDLEKIEREMKKSHERTVELCNTLAEASRWYRKHTGDPRMWRLPLGSPVDNALVTSEKGYRRISRGSRNHRGVDLVDEKYRHRCGAPIYATGNGRVIFVGRKRGYGNFIVIMHTDTLVSRYGHLQGFLVKEGDFVKRGQKIGTMGNTGVATGPHLDYSIKYLKGGRWVFDDPAYWIQGYDSFEFKYRRKHRKYSI